MIDLPDETILYRAIRNKQWIDPDNGDIDLQAFILRPHDNGSLSFNLTSEGSYARLKKCYGVIQVDISCIRSLGLSIAIDPEDPNHILVSGLPPDNNSQAANDIAASIAEQSTICENWINNPLKK